MRISLPLVKYLTEHSQFERFMDEYETLHSRDEKGKFYANTIAGCLGIAHDLNSQKIPYCIIGGLAVAFHIHQVDHDAFLKWRGTSDIDLLVQKSAAEKILRDEGYAFRDVKRGKKGAMNGIYDYAKDDNGEHLVLGLREHIEDQSGKDITHKLLSGATNVDVYSIPVKVPMIRDLVDMKCFANRLKDRDDIKLLRSYYKGLKL